MERTEWLKQLWAWRLIQTGLKIEEQGNGKRYEHFIVKQ